MRTPRCEMPRAPASHAATITTHTSKPDSTVKVAATTVAAAMTSTHVPPRERDNANASRQNVTISSEWFTGYASHTVPLKVCRPISTVSASSSAATRSGESTCSTIRNSAKVTRTSPT